MGIFLQGSFENNLHYRVDYVQFQSVVAVLVLEQDAVLLDDEEFIKLGEEVAVDHFFEFEDYLYTSLIYFKFYSYLFV